ncbi:hypothetical protein MOUN0_C00320 [Monosporozyma unispora]|nr:hypothetical protein C6P44_005251 [Kazachstania unispora]
MSNPLLHPRQFQDITKDDVIFFREKLKNYIKELKEVCLNKAIDEKQRAEKIKILENLIDVTLNLSEDLENEIMVRKVKDLELFQNLNEHRRVFTFKTILLYLIPALILQSYILKSSFF